jgi:hypothetical protein
VHETTPFDGPFLQKLYRIHDTFDLSKNEAVVPRENRPLERSVFHGNLPSDPLSDAFNAPELVGISYPAWRVLSAPKNIGGVYFQFKGVGGRVGGPRGYQIDAYLNGLSV